jgi:phage shock protein C
VRKHLYRSRTDRMLFGVAGGFAEWLDVDPALVRIVWALLVLAGGAGFLLYIVAAIVIPEAPLGGVAAAPAEGGGPAAGPTDASASSPAPNVMSGGSSRARTEGQGAIIFGVILLVAGAWFLVKNYVPNFDDRFVWPAILVVIGIFLIAGSMRRR